MSMLRDDAIVLRLADYSETSQVATLFSQQFGQLRLIAKGIKRSTAKRVQVGLDLLEFGSVDFVRPRGDASLGTLREWRQRDNFAPLRSDLLSVTAGLYAAEAVLRFTEVEDPHPQLFDALLRLLRMEPAETAETAETAKLELPAICRGLAVFQQALLVATGYDLRLDACVRCQRPQPPTGSAWVSSRAGGRVCTRCGPQVDAKRSLPVERLGSGPVDGDPLTWIGLYDYHLRHLSGRRLHCAVSLGKLLARYRLPNPADPIGDDSQDVLEPSASERSTTRN